MLSNRLYQIIFLGLTIFLFSSCNMNNEFDSNKWKQKGVDWWTTDVREKMVDNLIESNILKGMNEEQVINLLGQPEYSKSNKFEYLIREKYGYDIDPEYISNLIIEFDINGKVSDYRIEK